MSKRRAAVVWCTAAVIGSLAVACEKSEAGSPTSQTSATSPVTTSPQSTTTSSSGTELPFAGAPRVANPIEASKFSTDPCLALTSAQAAQLKVGKGQKSKGYMGMVCIWETTGAGSVDLHFLTGTKVGLSGIYQNNENGSYQTFSPIADIVGFPAVLAGDESDKDSGFCVMYVGLADDLAFQLAVSQSVEKQGTVDPCDVTKGVAEILLQTMKAGA